jgi:hypothetical protein
MYTLFYIYRNSEVLWLILSNLHGDEYKGIYIREYATDITYVSLCIQDVAASDIVFVTIFVTHNSFVSNNSVTKTSTNSISDATVSTTQRDAYIMLVVNSLTHTHVYIYIYSLVFSSLKMAQYEPQHVTVTVHVK